MKATRVFQKPTTLNDLGQELERIVWETGQEVRRKAFAHVTIEWKGIDDPVTRWDKEAEVALKDRIGEILLTNFLGEEYGFVDNGADYLTIIDPIDGTKSFAQKDFLTAMSVGFAYESRMVGGFVYDFMRDIMYRSWKGINYYRFDGQIYPIGQKPIGRKIKIDVDGEGRPDIYKFEDFDHISTRQRGGSIALQAAQLMAGCYNGMIRWPDGKFKTWDIAAGYTLLRDKGFYISDINGATFDVFCPDNGFVALRPENVEEIGNIIF